MSALPFAMTTVMGAFAPLFSQRTFEHAPVPIRWVLVCDPARRLAPQAWLSTELDCDPEQILRWFIQRWQLDTTCEDTRAHVALKTSPPAERPQHSPYHAGFFWALLDGGFDSCSSDPDQRAPVRMAAWYPKERQPFPIQLPWCADVCAALPIYQHRRRKGSW
jgi:hypothetical protein